MSTLEPESNNLSPTTDEHSAEKTQHPLSEIIQFAIIAIIIVIPIRMFIAQPFIVSGASMDNTFASGQYLIVDQVSYYFEEPQRGDVIVFRYPKDPAKFFIKRIIGLPGDTVAIDGNTVTITTASGTKEVLDEPYVKTMAENTFLTEELGEREYFVMGDNRDQSSDSRVWGVLHREKIVGRAWLRLFPLGTASVLPGEYEIIIEEDEEVEDN